METLRDYIDMLTEADDASRADSNDLNSALETTVKNERYSSNTYRNTTAGLERLGQGLFGSEGREGALESEFLETRRGSNEVTKVGIESSGFGEIAVTGALYAAGNAGAVGAMGVANMGKNVAKTLLNKLAVKNNAKLLNIAADNGIGMAQTGINALTKTGAKTLKPFKAPSFAQRKTFDEITQEGLDTSIKGALSTGRSKLSKFTEEGIKFSIAEGASSSLDFVTSDLTPDGIVDYDVTLQSTMIGLTANLLPSSGFAGVNAAWTKGKQYRTVNAKNTAMGEDGKTTVLSMGSEELLNMNDTLGITEDGKMDNNGFYKVKDLNNATGEKGAYIDGKNNFVINSPFLGELKGTIKATNNGDAALVIDYESSNIKNEALLSQYKEVDIFRVVDTDVYLKGGTGSKSKPKPYTSARHFDIDNDTGKLQANEGLVKHLQAQDSSLFDGYTTKEEKLGRANELVQEYRQDPDSSPLDSDIKSFLDTKAVNTAKLNKVELDGVRSSPTSIGAMAATGTHTGGLNKGLDKLIEVMGLDRSHNKTGGEKSILTDYVVDNAKRNYKIKTKTENGKLVTDDPGITSIYKVDKVITDGKHVGFKITGIKKNVLETVDNALSYSLAMGEVKSNNKGIYTADAVKNMAKDASAKAVDMLNIRAGKGETGTHVESIQAELEAVAEGLLKEPGRMPEAEARTLDNGTVIKERTLSARSIAGRKSLIDTARGLSGDKTVQSPEFGWASISREFRQDSNPPPVLDGKMAKTEVKASGASKKTKARADLEKNLEFVIHDDSEANLKMFEDMLAGDAADLYSYVNKGEDNKLGSFNLDDTIQKDIQQLREAVKDIRYHFEKVKKSGKIQFDTQIMESLRVRYKSSINPQGNKIMRTVFKPDVGKIDLTIAENMNYAQRASLGLLDVKSLDGKKVTEMTDAEIQTTWDYLTEVKKEKLTDVFGMDTAYGKWRKKYKTIREFEDLLSSGNNKEILNYVADAEGAPTLVGIHQAIRMKNGETKLVIFSEIDGNNQGPALTETMAGNLSKPEVGTGVDTGTQVIEGKDLYTQTLEHAQAVSDESQFAGNIVLTVIDDLKRIDVKFLDMGKRYGSQAEGLADTMAEDIFKKVMQTLGADKPGSSAHALMSSLKTIQEMRVDIEAFQKLGQDALDLQNEIGIDQRNGDPDTDIKVLENKLKGIRDAQSRLNTNGRPEYQHLDTKILAKAYEKLKIDRESTGLKARKKLPKTFNKSTAILTPDEVVAVKQLIANDALQFTESTVNKMFEHPDHSDYYSKGTPEYEAQLKRHEYNVEVDKFQKEAFRSFSQLYTDPDLLNSGDINIELNKVSDILAKASDKTSEQIRKDINKGLSQTKSTSIEGVVNAVVATGYKVDDLILHWRKLDNIIPKVRTHAGDMISLVTTDSKMGLNKTLQGKDVNVPSVGFRMINDPLMAIGQDVGIMNAALGNNAMSVMHASWGSKDTQAMAKNANDFFADLALNYNLFYEMAQTLHQYEAKIGGKLPNSDTFAYMARTSGKFDFVKGMEDFKNEFAETGTWADANRKKGISRLVDKAIAHRKIQEEYATGGKDYNVINMTDGSSNTVGSANHVRYNMNLKNINASRAANTTLDGYRNVELGNKTSNIIDSISYPGSKGLRGKINKDVSLEFDAAKSEYGDGKISLVGSEFNEHTFGELNHEAAHGAADMVETGNIAQYIQNRITNGDWKFTFVDKTTGKQIKSANQMDLDEIMPNIMESLKYNEALMADSRFFATAFDKPDLASIIEQQYMTVKNADGDMVKIYTMKDLISHIDGVTTDGDLMVQLNNFNSAVETIMNGSLDINNWMNGFDFPAFKSNLNPSRILFNKYANKYGENSKAFADNILRKNATLGPLFYMDVKSEGMAAMAGLSKGADAEHGAITADFRREAAEIVEKLSAGKFKREEVDNMIGLMISNGMHHLLTELQTHGNYNDFIKELSKYNINHKDNTIVKDLVQTILLQNNHSLAEPDVMSLVNKAKGHIRRVIHGNNASGPATTMAAVRAILSDIDTKVKSQQGNLLTNNHETVTMHSEIVDKVVAAGRLTGKSGKYFTEKSIVEKFYNGMLNDADMNTGIMSIFDQWMKTESTLKAKGLYVAQYGINPKQIYKTNSYRLSWTGNADNYAGTVKVGDSEVAIYHIPVNDLTLGEQNTILAEVAASTFEKGKAKLGLGAIKWDEAANRAYVDLNGEKIMLDTEVRKQSVGKPMDARINPEAMMRGKIRGDMKQSMDFSWSEMSTRNISLIANETIKRKALNQQLKIGRESGVLITKEEYLKLSDKEKAVYNNLGEPITNEGAEAHGNSSNNYIKQHYGEFYYQRRFTADLEGTKGMNIGKTIHETFGPEAGKVLAGTLKLAVGARDILKQTTLTWNAASWINSFTSAMSIYLVNADAGSMLKDKLDTDKAIKEHSAAVKALTKAYLSNDEKLIASKTKALEGTELYTAMKYGMSDTLRSDTYSNRAYKDNPIYQMIDSFTGDKSISSAIKTVQFDPSTNIGNAVSKQFDNLEVRPKMMLYFNKKRSGMSAEQAAVYTTMANPQYARNLSGAANMIDQVSPYTKYFVSFPGMAMFAFNQNPKSLVASYAMVSAVMHMSWVLNTEELTEEEKKLKAAGYINIPGVDYAKYTESMYNYFIPSKEFGVFSLADVMFVPDGLDRLAMPFNLNPVRSFNDGN